MSKCSTPPIQSADSVGRGVTIARDPLMVVDHLGDDETEELLREDRVEAGCLRQRSQSRHLLRLAIRVGGRQAGSRLVATDVLGDLEPLREQMDERGVDVVDARSIAGQLLIRHGARDATGSNLRAEGKYLQMMAPLPLLFVDHPFPDLYLDLVDGRATVAGSGTDDGLDQADAIIAGAVRQWNTAEFALAPNLTVISRVGVGYDNVDVADAHAAGVVVCNAPLAPMVSTAEHTMALLFAVTKHLPHQTARAAQGLRGEPIGRALELDGRVLGLIGLGRIASRVAIAAQALGMRVIANDPGIDESPVPGVDLVGFHELLAMSDVVSLHAPALASTTGMIDADALDRMKPGSYLVNCARGSLVDHDALLAALDAGHLLGAGLDVTDPEPLPVGHALLDRHDVVVTPHIASATTAGRRRLYEHAIDNALAVLDGRPASVVAPPT